ncbi:hypothetical protein NEDG_00787 [Nematocida displodere]|uniref:Thioredoxin domain-containing protein n=1 Tax=Nematocida displodere TaxID=1805483 RepID=A0A177ECH6_9MICR|nr:hypothetical protein NEDG_00787 [Nematocida displodere]
MKIERVAAVTALSLAAVHALVYDSCTVPPAEGLSITKYYRKECKHCQRIGPKISRIISQMEKNHIAVTGAMIDIDHCKDSVSHVEAIPTVIVSRNGKELLRITGDKSFHEIAKSVAAATGISSSIFKEEVKITELLKLNKDDFYSGFTGPWVVYFPETYDGVIEDILLQTYKTFDGDIKIGRYVGADKEIVASRYYIYDFPGILVMYDGILMRYNGEMTLAAFNEFCTTLVEPSFKEITTAELEKVDAPTFVVFYSDAIVANKVFRRIAHDLKMNAQTYKMKIDAPENENILRLAVFKNGNKFYYEGNINDEAAVREWLFHTHFPNLSKLTMDNFYSIFHGLKPVISIVADGGNAKEIEAFEAIALEKNRGSSSSPYVFAFVDSKEYPKFAETNFGVLRGKPLITFFDPEVQQFFGEKIKPRESIDSYFRRQLELFETKKLKKYEREYPLSYKWYLFGAIGLLSVGVGARMSAHTRRKLEVE